MQLQNLMLHGPADDHEMVDILALVLHHDEQLCWSLWKWS
jgi:hypothetical protein